MRGGFSGGCAGFGCVFAGDDMFPPEGDVSPALKDP